MVWKSDSAMSVNPNLSSPLTTPGATNNALVNGLARAVASPAARVFSFVVCVVSMQRSVAAAAGAVHTNFAEGLPCRI